MKVILCDIELDDFTLAMRCVKWLLAQPKTQKDAILSYGEEAEGTLDFFVKRNKASITVRRISRAED